MLRLLFQLKPETLFIEELGRSHWIGRGVIELWWLGLYIELSSSEVMLNKSPAWTWRIVDDLLKRGWNCRLGLEDAEEDIGLTGVLEEGVGIATRMAAGVILFSEGCSTGVFNFEKVEVGEVVSFPTVTGFFLMTSGDVLRGDNPF